MTSQTKRVLDGLLAIGPHGLDPQAQALLAFAGRNEARIGTFWALLPGEDPALHVPESATPVLAFDDEIAQFTPPELGHADPDVDSPEAMTLWYVVHPTPQPKTPTTHLPVYGHPEPGETGGDAILCLDREPLDRQIERLEAYSIRHAIRLHGVYVAANESDLEQLRRDFRATNRTLRPRSILTVGPDGIVHRDR